MSMISFGICALFLISTISAISLQPDVISAIIQNTKNVPIRCTVNWETFGGDPYENEMITIDSMQYRVVEEKPFSMGTWTAHAFLRKIVCGDLVLAAPFEGLVSQEELWRFRVESNKIVSVGPSLEQPEDK